MAARHPEVAQLVRMGLGVPPERGMLKRLSDELGVSAPTVSRWYSLESSPDPSMWERIEELLDMGHGELSRAAMITQPGQAGPTNAELLEAIQALHALIANMGAVIEQLAAQVLGPTNPAGQPAPASPATSPRGRSRPR